MRSIVFNVRPEVGEQEQESLLDRLGQLPGVQRAAALNPHSKNSVVRRMGYCYVNDDTDIDAVREQIARLPEVESAALPAERHLAGSDPA